MVRQIVTSANYDAGRAGNRITGIVLHTMVGTAAGAYSRFNNPASQVSVHYGIGLNGTVYQWVDEANTAYQAGNYQVNLTTIGIEHEDNGNYNDAVRTPAQYNASAALVADICKRYGIPIDTAHIKGHRDVIDKSRYPGGTACPDALDTNRIINQAKGVNVSKDAMTRDELTRLHKQVMGDPPGPAYLAAYEGKSFISALAQLENDPNRLNVRGKMNKDRLVRLHRLAMGSEPGPAYIAAYLDGLLDPAMKQLENDGNRLNVKGINKSVVQDYISKHLS